MVKKQATCHPDQPHHGRGLCRKCYWATYGTNTKGGFSVDVKKEAAEVRARKQAAALETAKNQLIKELHDKDDQIRVLTELRSKNPPKPIKAAKVKGEKQRRQAVPVMLLSDWHIEEPVYPEQVNGLNEYNLDIADQCISKCSDAFEWFTHDSRFDMREGVLWYGGDLYSGYIHEELQENNLLSPVECIVWLQEKIERQISSILSRTKLERLSVVCNDGNHGRTTHRMRISTRTRNSLEWLLYKTLAIRFATEPRVQFQIADGEYNYLDVYDQSLCFFHGDSVSYHGGVGGLLIPMRRGLNELRKYRKVDIFHAGHFHQRHDLGDIQINGSMIGVNAYSMHLKAPPEKRVQSWYLLDSKRGKCLSAPVWL